MARHVAVLTDHPLLCNRTRFSLFADLRADIQAVRTYIARNILLRQRKFRKELKKKSKYK